MDFGSVSLCHVAAGMTEAVVEFAEIIRAMDRRQRFVAAGSAGLAQKLVESLRPAR